MRDYNLRFFKTCWPDDLFRIGSERVDLYAQIPGCYVLGSSDGTNFIYPWGSSPVFYIGKSRAIRARVRAHHKWIKRAIEEHHSQHFIPLHQYGAAFGTDVSIYKTGSEESAVKLESELITEFYNIYGSIPVANGAWPKQMRKPLGTRLS